MTNPSFRGVAGSQTGSHHGSTLAVRSQPRPSGQPIRYGDILARPMPAAAAPVATRVMGNESAVLTTGERPPARAASPGPGVACQPGDFPASRDAVWRAGERSRPRRQRPAWERHAGVDEGRHRRSPDAGRIPPLRTKAPLHCHRYSCGWRSRLRGIRASWPAPRAARHLDRQRARDVLEPGVSALIEQLVELDATFMRHSCSGTWFAEGCVLDLWITADSSTGREASPRTAA
jgi:hypothetical protein